jgi:Protein of unknown function (DUF2877)
MASGALLTPVRIERCGTLARQILAADNEVQVVAVMPRALYLAVGDDLVSIGGVTLGSGPINVELACTLTVASPHLETGLRGHIVSGICRIGAHLAIDTRSGRTWAPPPLPPFAPDLVARSLERLRACATAQVPTDGLAGLILAPPVAPPRDALARIAIEPIACLRAGVADALSHGWQQRTISAARALVGLGPGLTPSGDDLLGGLLMALYAGGQIDLRDRMWQALAPDLGTLTSPISIMHLRATARGMASAPLHGLLDTLLRGDDAALAQRLAVVAAIGHTSGWDALAGLVLGLDVLADVGARAGAVPINDA